MCDYSLEGVPSRLAIEGEELVTHRFITGSLGLASVSEICALLAWNKEQAGTGIKATLKKIVATACPTVCAVCVPPGATLELLKDGAVEQIVTFNQVSKTVNRYRDAIRFKNGDETLLQRLPEGVRLNVLSLLGAEEREPFMEEAFSYLVR